MAGKRYSFVPPGGGPSYDWTRDHTFVKVSAADTGGAFALMEDNLKRELRGVYADSVWEHLAGTTSEPFVSGEHRQIAVKVIDDRGNELLVVRKVSEAEEAA